MSKTSILGEGELSRWLEKIIAWQAESWHSDLPALRTLLHQLERATAGQPVETSLRQFPLLGHLLGRLCCNPTVAADEECLLVLLRCCFILHTPAPLTALHRTANHWLQQVLCYFLLGPDITDAFIGCLLDYSHLLFRQQHLEQLVVALAKELTSMTQRISTQHLSLISLPIVSLPVAVPLVEALLLNGRADELNSAFLEATTCAISKGQLAIRPPALHSLWLSHLPALEGTLLCCLEGTLIGPMGPQLSTMEQKIQETGLAEACALHSEIFEAVMLFLRSLLWDSLNSPLVSYFIRIFTRDFVKAAGRLEVSVTSPWRSLLPTCLHPLLPLCLTRIEDIQPCSWSHHCMALAAIFQQAAESVANSTQVPSNLPLMMAAIGDWLDMSLWLCVLPLAPSSPCTFADLASLLSSTADKTMVKTMLVQASQKLRGFLRTDPAASVKHIEALCPLRVFCPDLAARLVTLSLLSTPGELDLATSLWKWLEPSPAMVDHAASILDFAKRVLSTSFCNDIYPSWLPNQSSTSKDTSVLIPTHLYHILGFSSDPAFSEVENATLTKNGEYSHGLQKKRKINAGCHYSTFFVWLRPLT